MQIEREEEGCFNKVSTQQHHVWLISGGKDSLTTLIICLFFFLFCFALILFLFCSFVLFCVIYRACLNFILCSVWVLRMIVYCCSLVCTGIKLQPVEPFSVLWVIFSCVRIQVKSRLTCLCFFSNHFCYSFLCIQHHSLEAWHLEQHYYLLYIATSITDSYIHT